MRKLFHLVLVPVTCSLALVACGEGSTAGGLFSTSCSDIGKRPADLAESTPTEVIVLLDVASNDADTAERIADDVAAVLGTELANHDDLILRGYTAGGTDGTLEKIDCMGGAEYFFGGGNERRQEAERDQLGEHLTEAMSTAVRGTEVAESGDARALLRQVPVVATEPQPRVILWSTFLEQGSDCLAFEQDDTPSTQFAVQVADRCAQENLLPDLGDARLTIVGAGSSADRPELGPFGKALASELCTRMAQECDVR